MDFSLITRAAEAAGRWHFAEASSLRLLGIYFDLEVTPRPDGADVVSMPYERPGPRTRVATLF